MPGTTSIAPPPPPSSSSSSSSSSSTSLSLEERFPFLREQTGRRRSRQLLTPEQTSVLLGILRQTRFPSTAVREQAAKELGISPRKVQVFFQNKRQGLRKKMLNAAQDLVDLAHSEETSNAPNEAKSSGGGAQTRQHRAMTLGGGASPGSKQTLSSPPAAEARTYDEWHRGQRQEMLDDDDNGMDVDGEDSGDATPDEEEEQETHKGKEQQKLLTPAPARMAHPLAAVAPATRARAASDAAALLQRGAHPRPQHTPLQQHQQQQRSHHPYARAPPRAGGLVPLQQPVPRIGAQTTSPRRATLSFAAAAPRTMPIPTRSLPMVAPSGMSSSSTSSPQAATLGLSNMSPPPPTRRGGAQHAFRGGGGQQHDARHHHHHHHQRSASLAAYPPQQHLSRVPLQPLPQQQQHSSSSLIAEPTRPNSLRRHASYQSQHAAVQPPVAAPVAAPAPAPAPAATLPFATQWRTNDQSYNAGGLTTTDGALSLTMGSTTHPSSSSGGGSSDMEDAASWTPASTRDEALHSASSKETLAHRHHHHVVISPRHGRGGGVSALQQRAQRGQAGTLLPQQWMMQQTYPPAAGRGRGLSVTTTTRKPLFSVALAPAPVLDLSLDVPLDVERLGSRSYPEHGRIKKRLNGDQEEAAQAAVKEEEQVSSSMTLPPLRHDALLLAADDDGDDDGEDTEDDGDDDAPLSKTCGSLLQPTTTTTTFTLPSFAELTRSLGLLPWSANKVVDGRGGAAAAPKAAA